MDENDNLKQRLDNPFLQYFVLHKESRIRKLYPFKLYGSLIPCDILCIGTTTTTKVMTLPGALVSQAVDKILYIRCCSFQPKPHVVLIISLILQVRKLKLRRANQVQRLYF